MYGAMVSTFSSLFLVGADIRGFYFHRRRLRSSYTGIRTPFGMWNNNFGSSCGRDFIGNPLGAICVIPTCAIVCFTHNAI